MDWEGWLVLWLLLLTDEEPAPYRPYSTLIAFSLLNSELAERCSTGRDAAAAIAAAELPHMVSSKVISAKLLEATDRAQGQIPSYKRLAS